MLEEAEELLQPASAQESETPALQQAKTETKEKSPALAHHASAQNQSIRVDLNRLDSFLDLVSELVVYRNQLEDVSERENIEAVKDPLEQVSRLTSELQDLVLRIRMQQVNVVFSRFPRMVRDLSNELQKKWNLSFWEETELDKTVVSELSEPWSICCVILPITASKHPTFGKNWANLARARFVWRPTKKVIA